MEYASTAGTRLKRIRQALGLSQEGLAEKLEFDQSSISHAERGKTKLSNHLIVALVKQCNVNVEYLLEGRGDMFIDTTSDQHLAEVMDDVLEAWIEAIQRIRARIRYN